MYDLLYVYSIDRVEVLAEAAARNRAEEIVQYAGAMRIAENANNSEFQKYVSALLDGVKKEKPKKRMGQYDAANEDYARRLQIIKGKRP